MMNEHYIHILESIPIGVIAIDLSGNIQTINKHAESIMNVPDNPMHNQNIATRDGGENMPLIGSLFPTECFMEKSDYKIKRCGKILEIAGAPLKDRNNMIMGAVFTIKDITERERTQALEKNHEKHAAIGELSADIAHDIRNPLGSIALFASLLKKELKRKKDIHRVNQILSAARSAESRISNLVLSSETHQGPLKSLNINDILKDILLSSEQIIDQETTFLSARYAEVEPIIECNIDIMKQVLLTLILNALQALQEGDRLDIRTNYLPETQTAEIHLIHNTPSTLKTIRSSIFDHLSQREGRNTGLGLAIIHNIVNMYNGSIRMEYITGGGTAFVLSFPAVSAKMTSVDPHKNPSDNKAANA